VEARRVPAQLIAIAAVAACGGRDAPTVSPSVDAWARALIARPVAEVCGPGEVAARTFCFVRAELVSAEVKSLGAHMVMLESERDAHYINLDWGGGHVDAYGVIIGPAGWAHVADAERKETKLRDGVFRYDTRL
jgi:hypothetical protein